MRFFYLRSLAVLIFAAGAVQESDAQANQFIRYLQAGPADARKLSYAYLEPVMEGLSYGASGGWYHTARTHQRLGFDISLSMTAVFLPSSAESFRPDQLGLENTTFLTPSGVSPTIVGRKVETSYQSVWETPQGSEVVEYAGAKGADFPGSWLVRGAAVPVLQAGVGIGKNTDVKLRFLPTLNFGSVTRTGLVGIGFMHDIKQHIPAWRIKTFDLSLFAGYSRVAGEIDATNVGFTRPGNDLRQQEMPFKVHAFLVQALMSKKLNNFTFYGGVGYTTVKTTADVLGSYLVFGTEDDGVILTDPFSLSFDNKSLRVNAGLRVNIKGFYLHGEYSLQEYSAITAGIGYTHE